MDMPAPSPSLNAHTETQADLESHGQTSVVQIQLPSTASFSLNSRSQRRVVSTSAASNDEASYIRSSIAIASSIFFSKIRKYPRSFLWRVLDSHRILELRSADLSKDEREKHEASVILQLAFPSTIRRGGIAFADNGEDALNVFVLTKSNDLCTLTIPTRFFTDVAASEEDAETWCKTFKPSSFTLSTPHRLVPASPVQLIILLSDGRLLRLNRKQDQDGSTWKELAYNDGGWSTSLRGLVRWQGSNTVRYDGVVLDHNTAIAAEFSPSRKHLLTVCANHTFKIWNLEKGVSVFGMDLLGQQRRPEDIQRMMLDAGNSEILRVFEAGGAIEGDEYYAMTYSPHAGGQFKIWAIRDADHGRSGVRFLHADDILRPPDPDPSPESKAVWKMADFKVGHGDRGIGMQLWVMMRSNKRYKIYSLKFDLEYLPAAWSNRWTSTTQRHSKEVPLPQLVPSDARDAPDLWLDYLLYPGRYPQAILETALSMYSVARKLTDATDAKASLEDRLCAAIASRVASQKVNLEEGSGTQFAQYRILMQQEWSLLYQEVQDLEKLRCQVLSLAYDDHSNMPWTVFTGGCAAIRECSRLEAISHNEPAVIESYVDLLETRSIEDELGREPKLPHDLATLIRAVADFRETYSPSFQHTYRIWLSNELWPEPLQTVAERIKNGYVGCNFYDETDEYALKDLEKALKPLGGFKGLSSNYFLDIGREMPSIMASESSGRTFSKFGLNVLVEGARDMMDLYARILLDLLVLIVFMEGEVRKTETLPDLDTAVVFVTLLEQLKHYEMMQWLAKNVLSIQAGSQKALGNGSTHGRMSTVLERFFAEDVKPQLIEGRSQSASLSDTIQDLLMWTIGGNYKSITIDQVLVHIQCNLLKAGDIELAADFLPFQPCTPWAMYIRGRLLLSLGEVTEAALCFEKTAYKLASQPSLDYHEQSAGYLSPEEAAHLGQGLPFFYIHVHQLFQATSYPSYAAQFAQLALQFTNRSPSVVPPTSLLISLVQSSLETSSIEKAYAALIQLPQDDQATLVPNMLKSLLAMPNGPSRLLDLPWPPHLHGWIDRYLADEHGSGLKPALKTGLPSERQRKILAAWRLRHGDFRGAAAVLYSQLQIAQKASLKSEGLPRFRLGADDENEMGGRALDEAYLSVINLMACDGGGQDPSNHKDGQDSEHSNSWLLSSNQGAKRKLVTISDVRKDWQRELDRRSAVEAGRYEFGLGYGDEMGLG
ncbi:MAG: hypothetical protein LQ352_005723 [Teloschistes flavicans]|nr:MAG: hypothetical protein LQ352_005723 [Teloschistes flavicans]